MSITTPVVTNTFRKMADAALKDPLSRAINLFALVLVGALGINVAAREAGTSQLVVLILFTIFAAAMSAIVLGWARQAKSIPRPVRLVIWVAALCVCLVMASATFTYTGINKFVTNYIVPKIVASAPSVDTASSRLGEFLALSPAENDKKLRAWMRNNGLDAGRGAVTVFLNTKEMADLRLRAAKELYPELEEPGELNQ